MKWLEKASVQHAGGGVLCVDVGQTGSWEDLAQERGLDSKAIGRLHGFNWGNTG